MDIRAQRSLRLLRWGLFECMKEMPFNEIVVVDVCKKAGLNRSTFYKYYKSCSDIIRDVEREQIAKVRNLYEKEGNFGEKLICDILRMLDEERNLFEAENIGVLAEIFKSELFALTKEIFMDDWKKVLPRASAAEAELAIEFLIAGSLHAVVNEGNKYDFDTRVKTIVNMWDTCIKMYS